MHEADVDEAIVAKTVRGSLGRAAVEIFKCQLDCLGDFSCRCFFSELVEALRERVAERIPDAVVVGFGHLATGICT